MGSGAAVGDLQVPIALGTQTGGSTIRPASFCGIYAFKPTWGAISREGLKLFVATHDTLGLYARSIQDLQLLADVFGLHDDTSPLASQNPSPILGLRDMRFALIKGPNWWSAAAGPGTVSATRKATALLRKHGAQVEEIDLPGQFEPVASWIKCVMNMDSAVVFLAEYRTAGDKLDQQIIDHVDDGCRQTHAEEIAALDGIAALRPVFDTIAARYTAVLSPSAPDEAPVGFANTGSSAFNRLWTAMHAPVVNIPGFKGQNNLPIGISLVAGRFRDRHLLDVSIEVGKVFEREGGWTRSL